ncbi:MAG: hypothetical protein HYR55_09750 [Acidobacteria bacterium]|nr:hypothetical protein [Acidobacteriota bacterium]MBI3657547.1 hypothetical protein [Acidobacteriota bacterium]
MKKFSLLLMISLALSTVVFAGGVDCERIVPCKFRRPGTPCAERECPAFIILVSQEMTIQVNVEHFDQPLCDGNLQSEDQFAIDLKGPGFWIVPFLLGDSCAPAVPYSLRYTVDDCDPVCGTYYCGLPNPGDCEPTD